MARQPLGRGLSALLGDSPTAAATKTDINVNEVDIDLIDPNPDQPRTRFVETALEELAASIRSNGIVQPIIVRRSGDRYQIVAGERRCNPHSRTIATGRLDRDCGVIGARALHIPAQPGACRTRSRDCPRHRRRAGPASYAPSGGNGNPPARIAS